MTNRVRIEILGAEYTIATPEEEEYVRRLAREIDAQVSQLLDNDSKLSPNAALILCALGYADSFYKSERSADHMRSQLSEYLEDAARARIELDDAKRELEKMRRQIDLLTKVSQSPERKNP